MVNLKMLVQWPVFRFHLAYVKTRSTISKCLVEIFANGCPPRYTGPVVTVTDLPEFLGVCNDIEQVCSMIRRQFLVPLGIPTKSVVWLLCYNRGTNREEWSHVSFGAIDEPTGEYQDPSWDEAESPAFGWDSLIPEAHDRIERRLVNPDQFTADNFEFAPDECFRMRTGICSLDRQAKPGDHRPGESGYVYCRGLSIFAHVWDLILHFYGGNGSMDEQGVIEDPRLWAHIQANWNEEWGQLPSQRQGTMEKALKLYGATDTSHGINGGYNDQGLVELVDGCHRSCVAQRLGITVAAFLSVETPRG